MAERITLSMWEPVQAHKALIIVFRRTSQLTKAECAELSEFVMAWAVDNDVRLSAPEGWA